MFVRLLLSVPLAYSLSGAAVASAPVRHADSNPDADPAGAVVADTIPEARGPYTLTVVLTGAAESGGRIGAALFDSPEHFLDNRHAAQHVDRPRTAPVDSFMFTGLEAGDYAIAAFHDVNGNGKIDKHWFGAPKESWGTSGSVRPRMRAPRFDEARVEVTGDVRVEIEVKR